MSRKNYFIVCPLVLLSLVDFACTIGYFALGYGHIIDALNFLVNVNLTQRTAKLVLGAEISSLVVQDN